MIRTIPDAVGALWTSYWVISLGMCFTALGVMILRLKDSQEPHLFALISLQAVMTLNLFLNYVAELNWYTPVLGDMLRVGAMVTTSLLVAAIPYFVNSQSATRLSARAGKLITIAGCLMAVHYMVSSIVFFAFRYDGTRPYFGGYRYIPAYTVYTMEALAILYAVAAFVAARPRKPITAVRLRILKRLMIYEVVFFPLTFVFDLVRYYFPLLWEPLQQEKLFLTPLNMAIASLVLATYAKQGFPKVRPTPAEIPGLSSRENEVARMLCEGMSYRQIADALHISLSTVQSHVKSIYRKTDVNTKEALIIRHRNREFP